MGNIVELTVGLQGSATFEPNGQGALGPAKIASILQPTLILDCSNCGFRIFVVKVRLRSHGQASIEGMCCAKCKREMLIQDGFVHGSVSLPKPR